MHQKTHASALRTTDIAYIGLFVAAMAICSWISIPLVVPVTLQTFAVFLAVGLLGGKRGTIAVCAYIFLGAIGVPVFAGFGGGPGALLGQSGGYIIGFIFTALIMWGVTKALGEKLWAMALGMVLGLIACYAFGTLWYMMIYTRSTGPVGVMAVLGWCVFPFIIPDLCKIALALFLTRRLRRMIRL